MSRSNRRRFIQQALVTGAGISAAGRSAEAAYSRTLSPALLYALAWAVLPTSALGRSGVNKIIIDFTRWLSRYEPVAEMNHGYFTGNIRYSPEHPGPRWAAQLEALEMESQKRFSASFADLDEDRRRELVSGQLAEDRLDRLPQAANARHVAVGLLAYFYALPDTTDLGYQAKISRRQCRPLAMAPNQPEPLDDEPGSSRG